MTEKKFRQIYPPEVIELMLQKQEEQGNPKNIQVFLKDKDTSKQNKGFDWEATIEGWNFWYTTLYDNNNVFYKKYPKSSNNILLLL